MTKVMLARRTARFDHVGDRQMRQTVTQGRTRSKLAVRLATLAITSVLALSPAAGCLSYPGAEERIDDSIVFSHYKKSADFQEYKTFAISTEIPIISEDDGEIERDTMDASDAADLLAETVKNLKARGYMQVERSENPDLGVTLSVLSGTVTTYYYDYWGYYWGYPYYYYYYPFTSSYTYDTGTLIVDMVDLKNAPPATPDAGPPGEPGAIRGQLQVIWTSLVYKVLSSSESVNLQAAENGITTAFKQSPYIQAE
jgi:hypothetical protein